MAHALLRRAQSPLAHGPCPPTLEQGQGGAPSPFFFPLVLHSSLFSPAPIVLRRLSFHSPVPPLHPQTTSILSSRTMSTRKRKQDAEEEEELQALPSEGSDEEEEE